MTLATLARSDASTIFDPTVGFGEAASFQVDGAGDAFPISVIFDQVFSAPDVGATVETIEPQVSFSTDDWPAAKQGDTLTIGSTTYQLLDAEPDGTGITICRLSEHLP